MNIVMPRWESLGDVSVRVGHMRPGEYITWKRMTRTGLASPWWVPNWNVGMVMMVGGGVVIGWAFSLLII